MGKSGSARPHHVSFADGRPRVGRIGFSCRGPTLHCSLAHCHRIQLACSIDHRINLNSLPRGYAHSAPREGLRIRARASHPGARWLSLTPMVGLPPLPVVPRRAPQDCVNRPCPTEWSAKGWLDYADVFHWWGQCILPAKKCSLRLLEDLESRVPRISRTRSRGRAESLPYWPRFQRDCPPCQPMCSS